MALFAQRDLSFFNFLIDASDNQLKSALSYMSPGQYVLLKRAAESIVEEFIPITAREFQGLAPDGDFIERLADGPRIRPSTLVRKRKTCVRLAHIAVSYYEKQPESYPRVERRLGSYESARQSENGQRNGHSSTNVEEEEEETRKSSTSSSSSEEEEEEEDSC